jgi:hypothetical protein
MIKANELRINNWVEIRGTRTYFYQITGHDIETIDDYTEDFDGGVHPIELTPSILDQARILASATKGIYNHLDLEIFLKQNRFNSWDFMVCTDSETADLSTIAEIKYLHQLQNIIFALTGEELPIKAINV